MNHVPGEADVDPDPEHPPVAISRERLVQMAIIVEGGMALIAICLGLIGFYDHRQDLTGIDWQTWQSGFVYGIAGTLPLLLYLLTFHFWNPWFFAPMRDVVDNVLAPLFAKCTTGQLLLISILAGFGEELFFRWCLQGGLEWVIGEPYGTGLALLAASLIFGLCHWINWSYGVITMLVGAYLGWLMLWTGWFIAPAVSHALFDFVALIYIVRRAPGLAEKDSSPDNLPGPDHRGGQTD